MEYTLTQEELTYLCWLRNKYTLPGLGEKPLGELTPEQTTVVLATVERTLLARDLLTIPMPGKPVLEPELERCISTACDANQIILLTKSSATRDPELMYIYVHNNVAVEHCSSSNGIHTLQLIPSLPETQKTIYQYIVPVSYGAPTNLNVRMAESVLLSARDAAQSGGFNAAMNSLAFNGFGEQQAALIATLISMPIQQTSMMYSDMKAGIPLSEAYLVETHLGTWMITSIQDENGIPWKFIAQASNDALKRQAANMVKS